MDSADPPFVAGTSYCNGGRTLLNPGMDTTTGIFRPGPMSPLPALDEGGNAWIDVRFGPLTRDWPIETTTPWSYVVAPPPVVTP